MKGESNIPVEKKNDSSQTEFQSKIIQEVEFKKIKSERKR